jgi:uncharacterized protein (AIM24 family)
MSETASTAQPARLTCRWCGCSHAGDQLSCPVCGAPSDAAPRLTDQGWAELPPIRDLARIRFGQSTCQIEGDVTPVADVHLAAGDGLYFMHHALLWREPALATSLVSLRDGFVRKLAGMPVYMMQASGPGRIAFSGMYAGDLFAVPLQAGEAIDVREHVLLVAEGSVRYDFFDSHIWYVAADGDDQKSHYPVGQFMDRFSAADRPGVVLLHAAGDVFLRDLADGESLLIQPGSLIYKSPSVGMRLHIEEPRQSGWTALFSSGRHRFLFLHLTGPGRVAIHSVFDQPTDLGSMVRHS